MFATSDEHAAAMKLVIVRAERYVYVTNKLLEGEVTWEGAMATKELFKEWIGAAVKRFAVIF